MNLPYYIFQTIYHYVSVKSEADAKKQDGDLKKLEDIIEDEMS